MAHAVTNIQHKKEARLYNEPINSFADTVPCKGLYDRKYEVLYGDGNAGATTPKSLWVQSRKERKCLESPEHGQILTECSCCTTYSEWKRVHKVAAEALQQIADVPCYYKVCDEQVTIGNEVFQGTIRALHAAPKGVCMGVALESGSHPYVCEACEALQHGKNSQLLHKLLRASKLKHPRSQTGRACHRGVSHKHCSKSDLETALQFRKSQVELRSKTITRLSEANERLLSESWKQNASARPFIEKLLELFSSACTLTDFDFHFLDNWLGKKIKGKYYHAGEQARSLAILLSNRLGEKMYSTIAPMMGLPLARQAQRLRASERGTFTYMPGLNDWAFVTAGNRYTPFHNSMDGTRVVRSVELYQDEYLVGESFPPDVRAFPDEPVKAKSWEQVQEYVLSIREGCRYAAEAYSFDLVDTTGKLADLLVGSIPEATSGVTASHIFALMLEVEKKAIKYNVSLIGHCTDSALNALNALLKLATPSEYLVSRGIAFLGLRCSGYYLFAPFLRKGFPSIAYACWDHSARTVVRNLINQNHAIVAEVKNQSITLLPQNLTSLATVQDLILLKQVNPVSIIKHGDISPYIRQNCDATSRVLTDTLIHELKLHVPSSTATQLYLQAAVWTHAPYRNDKFGPPPLVARSLWAGIMTWRRWRQYIILSPHLSLSNNFISRAHYLTEEVLVHAGINHLLCIYLCFPSCDLSEFSLRHTGNRGLEAIHGMFRGGTSSLPITSPNLSFREFLDKINASQQIKRAEHSLSQIEGSTIMASKKKRKTFATTSNESSSPSEFNYTLPSTYVEFLTQLEEAVQQGDYDSKCAIEQLAPQMAAALKLENVWDVPPVPFQEIPDQISIVTAFDQLPTVDTEILDMQTRELGSVLPTNSACQGTVREYDDSGQALANLLVDVSMVPTDVSSEESNNVSGKVLNEAGEAIGISTLLKGLQPQREVPSKDRGKRFAAGILAGNCPVYSEGNEVREFAFWTLFPQKRAPRNAKVFLLGQISLIIQEGKPARSAERNPSTQVVLQIYSYNATMNSYHTGGRTSLIKSSILHIDVSKHIQRNEDRVFLPVNAMDELDGYLPFSEDIDINSRLQSQMMGDVVSNEDSEDEFIAEQIVKKQFNAKLGQYECLIKWKEYSEKHNTWELISNIPEALLSSFEEAQQAPTISSTPLRAGLRNRTLIKPPYNSDFISNK